MSCWKAARSPRDDARDERGVVRQGAVGAARPVVRHRHWMHAAVAFPAQPSGANGTPFA